MANIETKIDEMITELNDLKDNAIGGNTSAVDKSQINVQSMSSDKVVIHFNLIQGLNESSICDNNDEKEEPNNPNVDKPYPDIDSGANDKSQISANGSVHRSQPLSDQSFQTRSSRRTISESINEDIESRGILKYSHNWIRRSVSESSCDFVVSDSDLFCNYQSIDDMFSDDELYCERKTKKNVRFSESVSKTIYRPNSSIMGRKLKNQKRAKNRKNRKNSDSEEQSENTVETERIRQDSGYDSEDYGHNHSIDDKVHKTSDCIETGIENIVFE